MDDTGVKVILGELKRLSDGQDKLAEDVGDLKTDVAVIKTKMEGQSTVTRERKSNVRWVAGIAAALVPGILALLGVHT